MHDASARLVATLAPAASFFADAETRNRLVTDHPWLGPAIEAFSTAPPAPPTVAAFSDGAFCRPPTSLRCFYYFPRGAVDGDGAAGRLGALAFKGLEPCAPDFADLLADFRRPGPSPHAIGEHFVHEEGKVPGCLTLDEATFEAERAAAYQRAHLAAYGDLAHAPVPLFVLRHTDETVARVAAALGQQLSSPAMRVVERGLAGGLGAYVYHYPTLPIRVREIDALLQGLSFRDRMIALLCDACDPESVVQSWVREFVRMLYCGFVPASLASQRRGMCCQPQNACIDGGFVDLDSLTRFDELVDDAAVLAAIQLSIDALIYTVRILIVGGGDVARDDAPSACVDPHHIREYVLALLRGALEREARPGLPLDRRVPAYLSPATDFGVLVERLAASQPRPPAFQAEARAFRAAMQPLLHAARRNGA
jgi:hypothetical protein